MADTKMFWGRSDKSKMFDTEVFKQRYELVKYAVEQKFSYEEFKNYCYDNNHNFSVITTVMNIFGLIQLDSNKILEKNNFLDININNKDFLKSYLEYYLSYWQYNNNGIIVKPYLLVLKILKLLKERNESPHLTEFEFTEIFKEFKNYDDINQELINKILESREKQQDNSYGNLGYSTKAYLQYSSLLSFNKRGKEKGFFLELVDSDTIIEKIDRLFLSSLKDDVFYLSTNIDNIKDENTEWGKFLNNENRFTKWKNKEFHTLEELGESGIESGIESDDIEDDFITPFDPDDISITSQTVALDTVLRRIKQNRIRLAPAFQRNSVWDDTRKSRLIESMMLKIPLPMFYVSSDKDNNWDVVDGLQRITTIKEFILGEYDVQKERYSERGFKLKKLEFWEKLNGQTYEELPGKLYNNIAETELSFTVINPDTPEEVKRNIFKRINTGGMPLTSQEIRHALYQGLSTKLLKELVEKESFLNAVDGVDDSRMGARELILRYLSFYIRNYTSYSKDSSMDAYLSNSMRIINTFDNFSLERIENEFKYEKNLDYNLLYESINFNKIEKIILDFNNAMIRAKEIFGEHTFRKSYPSKRRTPINKTLFEVFGNLLGALSKEEYQYLKKNKQQFLKEYKEEFLLKTDFAYMIGRDSHKVLSVKKRYEDLSKLIQKHI